MNRTVDPWKLYEMMYRSRIFEEAAARLWHEGKIYGEMHLGIGEEALMAGIMVHLKAGDSLSLDHRGTPPLVMRGIDPVTLLLEFLGHEKGLCGGNGGHMHLFSKDLNAASSGIVGAAGPSAAGFALSFQYRKVDNIAVAFFGEGALNQGMLMESMNLASAWNLPVLFVCKDNDWAITTVSEEVSGGTPCQRARGFGLECEEVDGLDAESVARTAGSAIDRIRHTDKPFFLHGHCVHTEGHFLGDPLLRVHKTPVKTMSKLTGPLVKSVASIKGAGLPDRGESLGSVLSLITRSRDQMKKKYDPVEKLRKRLEPDKKRLEDLEKGVKNDTASAVSRALEIFYGTVAS